MQQLPLFDNVPVRQNGHGMRKKPGHARPLPTYEIARNNWQTPQQILEHVIAALGAIDLDPCSSDDPTVPAKVHYTIEHNSLSRPWEGRVWLNPPYGRAIGAWIDKLCDEYENGGVTAAIALVPARSDTQWWQRLSAYPYCAIHGRIKFIKTDGKTGHPNFPSAAVYLGPFMTRFAGAFADLGTIYAPYNTYSGEPSAR
jgi:phage N-6-adenine-methyltransferase